MIKPYRYDPSCTPEATLQSIMNEGGRTPDEIGNLVEQLATHCAEQGNLPSARCYAEFLVMHETKTERRAICYLKLGGILEAMRDYAAAADAYAAGAALNTPDVRTAYYLHNNLGFSLNQIGVHPAPIEHIPRT